MTTHPTPPMSKPDARIFAWFTDDFATDKSATTYDPVVAGRWIAKGWPVTTLVLESLLAEAESRIVVLQSRLDAAEAEVTRLTQLMSGGKGGLPEGAVAWLDMGKGEASITFNKKHDSNRASKRNAMELFNRVPAGYYPLYLSPKNEELRAALGCATTGEGGE